MLAKRPDVRAAMIKSGSHLCIIAHDEFTTDLPEWARMTPKDYWDAPARGTGGSSEDPLCTCGEENLLAYPGDPLRDGEHFHSRVRAQHSSARHGQRGPDLRSTSEGHL
jgi:hypothetical protein